MTELANAEARPTEARLLHMVFPDHTNHLGTLFGGQALAWMDMAAFIVASRWARTTVVTARSEQVDFNQPIHKGDLVEVVATIVKVGRSSMNVEVEVITENLLSGERKLCTRGRFVMIALDPLGQPTAAPTDLRLPLVAVSLLYRKGTPLEITARMETESILFRTLALFGAMAVLAAATFIGLIWFVKTRKPSGP